MSIVHLQPPEVNPSKTVHEPRQCSRCQRTPDECQASHCVIKETRLVYSPQFRPEIRGDLAIIFESNPADFFKALAEILAHTDTGKTFGGEFLENHAVTIAAAAALAIENGKIGALAEVCNNFVIAVEGEQ